MLINALSVDTVVNICVTNGENRVRLDSQVISLTNNDKEYVRKVAKQSQFESFTVLELIKENNMTINFLSANVICYITAQKDGKPYSWKDVKIIKLNLPDYGYAHIAFCNDDPDSFNRREEFRLWLGYDAYIKINDSKVPHQCMIKDLSGHGGGFIISSDYEIKINDVIHLQFHESIKNEVKNEWEDILHSAVYRVVRVINMKNNKNLIGCTLIGENDGIIKFLARKQRERLHIGGRTGLFKQERDSKLSQKKLT